MLQLPTSDANKWSSQCQVLKTHNWVIYIYFEHAWFRFKLKFYTFVFCLTSLIYSQTTWLTHHLSLSLYIYIINRMTKFFIPFYKYGLAIFSSPLTIHNVTNCSKICEVFVDIIIVCRWKVVNLWFFFLFLSIRASAKFLFIYIYNYVFKFFFG